MPFLGTFPIDLFIYFISHLLLWYSRDHKLGFQAVFYPGNNLAELQWCIRCFQNIISNLSVLPHASSRLLPASLLQPETLIHTPLSGASLHSCWLMGWRFWDSLAWSMLWCWRPKAIYAITGLRKSSHPTWELLPIKMENTKLNEPTVLLTYVLLHNGFSGLKHELHALLWLIKCPICHSDQFIIYHISSWNLTKLIPQFPVAVSPAMTAKFLRARGKNLGI